MFDKLFKSQKIAMLIIIAIVVIVALSRHIQTGNINIGSGIQKTEQATTNINITIPNNQNSTTQTVINNGSNNSVSQTMK